MSPNGHRERRWLAAETHFTKVANKWVIPAIAYAQQMAARAWYSPDRVAGILTAIREMEAVRRLYTGPILRSMEGELHEADKVFQAAMARLTAWDK